MATMVLTPPLHYPHHPLPWLLWSPPYLSIGAIVTQHLLPRLPLSTHDLLPWSPHACCHSYHGPNSPFHGYHGCSDLVQLLPWLPWSPLPVAMVIMVPFQCFHFYCGSLFVCCHGNHTHAITHLLPWLLSLPDPLPWLQWYSAVAMVTVFLCHLLPWLPWSHFRVIIWVAMCLLLRLPHLTPVPMVTMVLSCCYGYCVNMYP